MGKSTLVNRLVGDDVLDTGETRIGDGKGRHTTTARHLIPLADGAVLIDTPGLRSVGLTDAHEGISHVFGDVEALMTECRFRNCSHGTEPGCAVEAAIEQGALDRRRFDSYLKLEREQERLQERKAAIARRAERKSAAKKRARVQD